MKLLKHVTNGLIDVGIVRHKVPEVKLLAACCFADILRVFAPDAPYPSSQLQVKILTFKWIV